MLGWCVVLVARKGRWNPVYAPQIALRCCETTLLLEVSLALGEARAASLLLGQRRRDARHGRRVLLAARGLLLLHLTRGL